MATSKVTIESEELGTEQLMRLIKILLPPWLDATVTPVTPGMTEILGRSVFDLELSIRSWNALKHAEILTVAALVGMSEFEVFRLKGVGRISAAEIRAVVQALGLSFRPPVTQAEMDYAQRVSR